MATKAMETAATDTQKTTGVVSDNVHAFEKKAENLYQKGQEAISEAMDKVGPALHAGYEKAEKTVTEAVDQAGQTIKKYPLQSLVVSFGIGLLAGALIQTLRKD